MPPRPSARAVAEEIYALEGAEATTVDETIAAVLRVCHQLERGISSLVGKMGFHALFARCVRKASGDHPCLRDFDSSAPRGLLESLKTCLAGQPPAVITDIGTLILALVFDLVSTLIGDDLTLRLVRDIWPDALRRALDSEKS
jgi:hypothetical protein